MTQVMLCGPLSVSGGVSTHTKCLKSELDKRGVEIQFFNLSSFKYDTDIESNSLVKGYQRTGGLFLNAFVWRKKFKILHVQASGPLGGFLPAITGVFSALLLRKNLIVTFHYSETEQFIEKYPKLFKFVLHHCTKMILVANRQRVVVEKKFPAYKNKIYVIPNGYISELFYPRDQDQCRTELSLPHGKKIIFSISNLLESKGYQFLIESISKLSGKGDILCIIGGYGNFQSNLEEQIKKIELAEQVRLIGWIPSDQIPLWINACDIFVLPSLAEGNPIVMFECLGCGKPFIGTNVGGIPEIINSEDIGYVIPPKNVDQLTSKILKALEKKWDSSVILKYGQKFSWEKIAGETLEIYRGTESN